MPVLAPLKTAIRRPFLVALSVACLGASADLAHGQPYYYQPAPDYYHNDTAAGTFTGGALGAVTGALIGGRGNRGEGALIGAGVGAITGNLLGRSKDRADQYHAAAGAATVARANQQAAAMAVTNYDLLGMTRAGVSDEVIISTMRSRGAQLDLSPQGLITMKQSGVSDRVLLAAQDMGAGRGHVALPPPPMVAAPAPTTVIVTPGPYYRPYYGPRHYYHRPYVRYHVGF